jgi:hypothetical protein
MLLGGIKSVIAVSSVSGGNSDNTGPTHSREGSSFMPEATMPRKKSRYHTIQSAAERLERSDSVVKKWCQDETKRQVLGAFKQGKVWKIPFDHLEKLIERAQATGGNIF